MSARRVGSCAVLAAVCLLTGCHHHAAVRSAALPPPPAASAGPVMVSVPPPTHTSTDESGEVATRSSIPVVKPVRPPKKSPRRSQPTPPAVAVNTPPVPPPPQAVAVASPPATSLNLGQLTSSTDDPTATRDGAAQAMRRERDRIGAIPGAVQSGHTAEIDQARRFLKSAFDSWNVSDYSAAIALTTKARVLLDDLLK